MGLGLFEWDWTEVKIHSRVTLYTEAARGIPGLHILSVLILFETAFHNEPGLTDKKANSSVITLEQIQSMHVCLCAPWDGGWAITVFRVSSSLVLVVPETENIFTRSIHTLLYMCIKYICIFNTLI